MCRGEEREREEGGVEMCVEERRGRERREGLRCVRRRGEGERGGRG